MAYCKVLLRSLLVLTVLVLAYVLVAVAPASAVVVTRDIAVVRGTDNGVYWNSYSSGVLIPWGQLAVVVGYCFQLPRSARYNGLVGVVVRGTDNGIYEKDWSEQWWLVEYLVFSGADATIHVSLRLVW